MASWVFFSDEEGWTLAGNAAWDGTEGHGPGCISGVTAMSGSIAVSLNVTTSDPWSYWLRIVAAEDADLGEVPYQILASGAAGFTQGGSLEITSVPYDTGWFKISGNCNNNGEITGVQISVDDNNLTGITAYFDSVYFAESEPAADYRYLGLAADQASLYATVFNGGTLELRVINLESLSEVYNPTFGAATMSEIDNRTRALAPVVRPGAAGLLFLRGRDGNDLQVQYSGDNGQTFGDVGDAGWAADKVCVGLLPDPLRPDDLLAAFGDNDLFRTEDNAATWVQTGDAPATLRAAGRSISDPEELLLAAQAADTMHFTNNLGETFVDVSDAALNTINVIEVSRG